MWKDTKFHPHLISLWLILITTDCVNISCLTQYIVIIILANLLYHIVKWLPNSGKPELKTVFQQVIHTQKIPRQRLDFHNLTIV